MKAYLITTGVLFGLIAAAHLLRAIDEPGMLKERPGEFAVMAALGVLAAGLSIWAWRLLFTKVKP